MSNLHPVSVEPTNFGPAAVPAHTEYNSEDEHDIQAWTSPPESSRRNSVIKMPRSLRTPRRPLPNLTADRMKELSFLEMFLIQFDIRHVGMPIGFTAFTSMWRALHLSFGPVDFSSTPWHIFWYLTATIAALVGTIYIVRGLLYPHLLYRDFTNNILTNFFAAPCIIGGGLILAVPPSIRNEGVIEGLFYVLLAYQSVLSLFWYGDWLFATGHSLRKISALYFMAVINFFILASVSAGMGKSELAAYLFMIGSLFWLLVFISSFSFLSRSFEEGNETPSPTLFLFLAPPAAAAIAAIAIARSRGLDEMSDMLRFYSAVDLFLYLLLLRLFASFVSLKFNVGWWAYVFPLGSAASLAVELSRIYNDEGLFVFIASTSCLICLFVVVVVSMLTLRAFWKGEIPKSDLSLRVHFQMLESKLSQGTDSKSGDFNRNDPADVTPEVVVA